MTVVSQPERLTSPEKREARDFASDQEVRWCPGCGDYAILKAVQKVAAELGLKRHETVFVSGIGCSSRFPYYMSTYGFHTIHGRAPAVATGLKLANPELDVWLITGDGDGLSIGGNHLMHLLRRNLDLAVLLFNNEVYGLTKGQYSPTSRIGTRSPSTPGGSLDNPISPALFALGAGAHFLARAIDTQQKHLAEVLKRAHAYKGTGFVEIFQNCIVYNDDVFADFTARDVAAERQILVEHGKPLVFGSARDKGLRLAASGLALEVVSLGKGGLTEGDLLLHDETNRTLATLLAELAPPAPVALGVLYAAPEESCYEQRVLEQVAAALGKSKDASGGGTPGPIVGDFDVLLRSGHTWTVG